MVRGDFWLSVSAVKLLTVTHENSHGSPLHHRRTVRWTNLFHFLWITVYRRKSKSLKSCQVNQYQHFISDCSPLKIFVSTHLADMEVILHCDTKEKKVVEGPQERLASSGRRWLQTGGVRMTQAERWLNSLGEAHGIRILKMRLKSPSLMPTSPIMLFSDAVGRYWTIQ